ncbi:MAG: ATP-grasp domain-containing protein [Chloroflexi bacterium]|nr:ATP-grasp domain-containing protein [Chloroflexota bacterium]
MGTPALPQRLILLASAQSYRSAPFEVAAARLGLEVVKGKDVPQPMLEAIAGENTLPLDYHDIEKAARAIVEYARQNPVGALIGLDDSGTMLAAAASSQLELAHNSPQAAKAARNKHVMRQSFAEAGVPSPKFMHFHFDVDPAQIADLVDYPCVIKPVTLAGSRGVMRADNPQEFIRSVARLRKILLAERCEEFLVEDYIPGVEVALEGLLDDGELHVLALFDKPDPLEGPFFEETIYVTPSRLPDETQQEVIATAGQAAAALGLRNGPLHAELRVNQQGAWMVEMASRSIGGMCSQSLHFNMDMTLEELILRQAFGLDFSEARQVDKAEGVMMIPIPEAGLLKGVSGVEEARAVAGVDGVEITASLGHSLVPLPEGNSYLGFIFASGENPAEVEAALRAAHGKLRFKIAPEIELSVV